MREFRHRVRSKKARWSRLSRVRRAASLHKLPETKTANIVNVLRELLSPLVSEVATLYRALMTTAARRRRTPARLVRPVDGERLPGDTILSFFFVDPYNFIQNAKKIICFIHSQSHLMKSIIIIDWT